MGILIDDKVTHGPSHILRDLSLGLLGFGPALREAYHAMDVPGHR